MCPLMPVYPQIWTDIIYHPYKPYIEKYVTQHGSTLFYLNYERWSLKHTIIITRSIDNPPSSLSPPSDTRSFEAGSHASYRSPFANNISIRYSRCHETVIRQPPLTLQVSRRRRTSPFTRERRWMELTRYVPSYQPSLRGIVVGRYFDL